jgi:imidazolonepropionase-like amidohydrolase
MMRTGILLTPALALGLIATAARANDLVAIKVGKAETIANGTIEHAVILIEGSKIVTIGEDLPVDRGIPVIERPDWVVTPGLVDAYSRIGMDGDAGGKVTPEVHASDELYPEAHEYEKAIEYGVTTLGLYPAGSSIPGLAVAVRTLGKTKEEMILKDEAYLKIILRAQKSSKKALRDGFEKADKHEEKVQKAREKWEKDVEKKKKKKSSKKDDEKEGDKKDEEEKDDVPDVFVPPEPDPQTRVFLDLRAKKVPALVSVGGAAEYLHFLDALGDEDIDWSLRLPLAPESDLFFVERKDDYGLVVDGIGDKKARVLVEPRLTRHPGTMRWRNIPAELAAAGARLVFIPAGSSNNDDVGDLEQWLFDVGEVVARGLDRQTALRALTLEPAAMLGVSDRLGSLEKDKDANLVFFDGDPFEPSTRIQAVMLEGDVVFGEVNP